MDHIVLNTRDVDATLHFYTDLLGLSPERVDEFKAGKAPFPSVRINSDTIIDLQPATDEERAQDAVANQDHFCLVLEPTDMEQLASDLRDQDVTVTEGPVTRWGAHGNATSIYITGPDDNLIELRHY
jgi:catechol 2,3-dioxygenase-like lactoylglutathione lyase family enzyme